MSLQHEDSDSFSDDSVCFGPYTMEEAKRDAKKCKPRQIDQRHSSIYRYRHFDSSEAIDTISTHFEEATNISSNTSEYLTSNETVHTENGKSSDFLEKLSKVINEPISGSTSFNTALDQTNVHGKDNSHQEEELEISAITISDDSIDSSSQLNTSDYEFVTKDMNESRSPVPIYMEKDCRQIATETISDDHKSDEMAIKQEIGSDNSSLIIEHNVPDCSLSHSRVSDEAMNSESVIGSPGDVFDLSNPRLVIEYEDRESNSSYSDISDQATNREVVSQNSDAECLGRLDQSDVPSLVIENKVQGSSFSHLSLNDELSDYKVVDQKETIHSLKREIDCQSVEVEENYLDDSSEELDIISPTPQEKNEQAYFGYKQLSKITEKTEYTTVSDRFASTSDFSENIPEIEELPPASSPVQIPSINLNQFDDSCNFDDTLEEMNRFLEQGAEYTMPEKTPTKARETSKMEQSVLDEDNYSCAKETSRNIFNPISGSFMNNSSQDNLALRNNFKQESKSPLPSPSPYKEKLPVATDFVVTPSKEAMLANAKKCYSAGKVTKPTVEIKGPKTIAKFKFQHVESKIKPPSVFGKALFTKTTPNQKSDSAFKFPTKPAKRIVTPSKILNPSLKNVVSPIGVYINNAPKYCPMIKVPENEHKFTQESKSPLPGPSSYKENLPMASDFVVPPVIYKPAQKKLASEVRGINLPGNIQKLIAPRTQTKHEQRIEAVDHNQSVDRRLLESDLSIDVSLQSNPDISILTNKQGYKIRQF